jgi:hypothetical protein
VLRAATVNASRDVDVDHNDAQHAGDVAGGADLDAEHAHGNNARDVDRCHIGASSFVDRFAWVDALVDANDERRRRDDCANDLC